MLIGFLSNSQEKYRNFYTSVNNTDKKEGLALVLANEEYINIGNLEYAIEDGEHMIAALKKVKYDMEIGLNLNKEEMTEAINSFASKLKNYKNAVIYYSGHGVELDGTNYILPLDVKGTDAFSFKNSAIDINALFFAIDNPRIPKVIVLDACRESPVQFKSNTKSVKGGGLAEVQARTNSIVVFSTAANTSISDNNIFTETLSENIKEGGCINDIVRKTRKSLIEIDKDHLIFEDGALTDDICFGDSQVTTNLDDFDNDGIANNYDQCPKRKGPLENFGCPFGGKIINNTLNHFVENSNIGISDAYGEIIIHPKYDFISTFSSEGIAAVLKKGKWGYINKKGQEIIIPESEYVSEFRHGRGVVSKKGSIAIVDVNGQPLTIENSYSWFFIDKEEPLISVYKDGKWGMINIDGKEIIPPKYSNSIVFSDGLASVKLNNKNLYIDPKGDIKLVNSYDYSSPFKYGRAIIEINDRQGVMDRSGKVLFWFPDTYIHNNKNPSIKIDNGYIYLSPSNDDLNTEIFDLDGNMLNYDLKNKYIMDDGSILCFNTGESRSYIGREHLGENNIIINKVISSPGDERMSFIAEGIIYNLKGEKIVDLNLQLLKDDVVIDDSLTSFGKMMDVLYVRDGYSKFKYIFLDSYYRPLNKLAFIWLLPMLQEPYYKEFYANNSSSIIGYLDEESNLYGIYSLNLFKKYTNKAFFHDIKGIRGLDDYYIYEVDGKVGLYNLKKNKVIIAPIFEYIRHNYRNHSLYKANFSDYKIMLGFADEDISFFSLKEIYYNTEKDCFNFSYRSPKKRKYLKKLNILVRECD